MAKPKRITRKHSEWDGSLPRRCDYCGATESEQIDNPKCGAQPKRITKVVHGKDCLLCLNGKPCIGLESQKPKVKRITPKRITPKEPKIKNRILSVTIRRMVDENPDTSYLGEYGSSATSEYAIDRAHSEDCASVEPNSERAQKILGHARSQVWSLQEELEKTKIGEEYTGEQAIEWQALDDAYYLLDGLVDEVSGCDCGERGDTERNEYRYFNPNWENYKGCPDEEIRKYCRQDYERMESLNRGNWYYIGIRADAEIEVQVYAGSPPSKPHITYQTQKITSGGLWGIESDSGREYIEEEEKNQLSDLRDQLRGLGFSTRAISTAFKSIEHKES